MIFLRNQFHMAFFASALAISISVLIFTLLQKRTSRPQNRWFITLLCIVLLNSISEILTAVLELIVTEGDFYLVFLAQNSYFLFHTALCPMLYDYVSSVTGKNRRRSLNHTLLLHIPFFATELLAILNPIFNWVFYYDANLVFTRNWAEYLIYVAAAFYFFMSISELLFSWHAITPRRSAALTYFFLLTFVGVVIQLINVDIKAELISEALALMGAMLAIESEDDRLDVDTGIYNRRALHMDMHNVLVMNEPAQLIYVKIINAKIIERVTRASNYDILAIAVADYLKSLIPSYKIYHPNKETFVLICNTHDKIDVKELVNQIKARFDAPWHLYGSSFKLDAMVLNASIPEDISNYDDIAYIADSIIPPRVATNHAEIEWIMRRADIERAIRTSLLRDCFEVYYQPTFYLDEFKIHGAEALVRMHDDNIGNISPEEFIPIAEQIGLVDQIDDFVLCQVCEFIKSGVLEQYNLDCINVNLSVIQCLRPGFFAHILNIVDGYKIPHSSINFEITESVGAEDYEALSLVAHQLKAAGFALSMDDYGTGYSNMEGIFSLDFDIVKIDKTILWSAENGKRGRVILENSVRMIHGLGCKVLVEGVESESHIEMLKNLQVDFLQGYYFSKPLQKDKFIEYIG
jgi:EAL domain-containing protein (putative c-di-GMP-specific phosphodiesterase class I)